MAVLVLATNNPGKIEEYRSILADLPWQILSLSEAGIATPPPETGHSFRENALLKAIAVARMVGSLSLADDSGLEVDVLGGAPGIFSARYGGEELTDSQRNALLLSQLEEVPWNRRTARFRAVAALAWPDGPVKWCEGICTGIIARLPRGSYGFGYDPIFYLPEWGCTMAELPPHIKNVISHRAQAGRCVRSILERLEGIDT